MTRPVITAMVDDELSAVEEKFIKNQINHIVVIDGTNRVVGLISQKYLYKTRSPRRIMDSDTKYTPTVDTIIDGDSYYLKETLDDYILEDIMLKNPFTMNQEDTVAAAVKNMVSGKRGCIPVIDKTQKICGVITNHEIMRYLEGHLI